MPDTSDYLFRSPVLCNDVLPLRRSSGIRSQILLLDLLPAQVMNEQQSVVSCGPVPAMHNTADAI
jgi:hypothetical protein